MSSIDRGATWRIGNGVRLLALVALLVTACGTRSQPTTNPSAGAPAPSGGAAAPAAPAPSSGGPATGPTAAEEPRRGGELVFVVPSELPSYDGHREGTFGTVHPLAPLYNLSLIHI